MPVRIVSVDEESGDVTEWVARRRRGQSKGGLAALVADVTAENESLDEEVKRLRSENQQLAATVAKLQPKGVE